MSLRLRELKRTDWPAIEELFGPRGACGGCWCMVWRSELRGAAYRAQLGEANRLAFKALVESGHVHGVLAFDGARPVGWCSVGPRLTFAKLQRSRALHSNADASAWSITCFYVKPMYRGCGLATKLGDRAVRVAARHGATSVEGYPAVVYDAAKGLPAAFAWTGVEALFRHLSFRRVRRRGRPIYRKEV